MSSTCALRHNGVIECPMSEMPDVGERDCMIVALNMPVGHAQYSREKLARINARLGVGDMPVGQSAT